MGDIRTESVLDFATLKSARASTSVLIIFVPIATCWIIFILTYVAA